MPAQLPIPLLPLWGSAPFPGASACLAPVCWSTPGVALEGSLLCHLVFSPVPCSSSGPAAYAVFPAAGSLRVFRSPGVCPSASLVPWVGLSPSLLSGLLLLHLLAGVVGVFAPCVRVLQLHWVDGAVDLLPFPYLRVGVLLAYGVSSAGYNFKALSCTAAPRDVCNTRLAALTPDP